MNHPTGHLFVDFKNLCILVLLGKPCNAHKLICQDDVGNCLVLGIRQLRYAIVTADDIPVYINQRSLSCPKVSESTAVAA